MPQASQRSSPSQNISRPPLERMHRIHNALARGRYPNCSTLAKQLEVSVKTVQRDITFMRDRLHVPIAFDRGRNGYYYTEPVESLPAVQVTEGEVVALYIAQKVLAQYQGTSFEEPLAAAFRKLTQGLQDSITFPLDSLDEAISFRFSGRVEPDPEVFTLLHRAIESAEEVVFKYRAIYRDRPKLRWVRPYHLLGASGGWYLVAFDPERDGFRLFALQRMRDLAGTGKKFEKIADFDPKELFHGALEVFVGSGEKRTIRIWFDSFAAQFVKERLWHASQRMRDLPGDEVEVTFELNSFFEIERWILGWGDHARVIEPVELRERIVSKAEGILAAYKDGPAFMEGERFIPRRLDERTRRIYRPV